MTEEDRDRPGARAKLGVHLVAWTILAAVGVALFAQSYQRWGHPIIDNGRDLDLPSQILAGRVLYRDLIYNYGPITPYLLTGVVALFGDDLWVFEAFGITIGALAVAALYAIGNQLGGVRVAFASSFLFLALNFFANSTWGCNFVLPYSEAATLGIVLALWSYYLLHRYLYAGRRAADLAWSTVLLFATLFTKAEIGLAIGGVHVVAWWAHRVSLRAVAATVLVGVGLGALFVLVFSARGPQEHALFDENLTKFAGEGLVQPFFLSVAGLDHPLANLEVRFATLAGLAVLLWGSALAAALPEWIREREGVRAAAGLAAVPLVLAALWWLADVRLFGAAVLVAPVLLVILAVRCPRDPLLLLSAFALFSAPRILLQYHPLWYGFALSVPVYPLAVYGLGVRLPARCGGRRELVVVLCALAALMLLRFEYETRSSFARMSSVLHTPKGTLRDWPNGRTEAIDGLLRHLERLPDRAALGMVVFPEGVTLNYFAGIPNPTAYQIFTPPEIRSPTVEARILEELARTRPELLVLTSRDLQEYGSRGFGIDYGRDLLRWIRQNYRVERTFGGEQGKPWKLILLRLK